MEASKDQMPDRIDDGKRDFLKKLAIGTAYAAPAIATFSLDSIRSKAYAQAAYGVPDVLSVQAVPATASGDYLYGSPPEGFYGSEGQYYWVITYDRPMNPAYASAKVCKVESIDYNCNTVLPSQNPTPGPPDNCGTCALTWEWNSDNTRERAAVPLISGVNTASQRLTLWLNHSSCAAGILYRDTHGTLLPPFVGIADLCNDAA